METYGEKINRIAQQIQRDSFATYGGPDGPLLAWREAEHYVKTGVGSSYDTFVADMDSRK